MAGALALAVVGASLGAATAASAAPVYEIDGRWAPDTPTGTVGSGDVINAEWRVNVNDSAEAPSNDPVDNVTFTTTVEHGLITTIPDACLTTGVDPVSAISADNRTLTCNLGAKEQGTAVMVLVPVTADGETADQVSMSGQIAGQTDALDPIEIRNSFAMDMQFGGNTGYYTWKNDYTSVTLDLQWALRLARGSDRGPDTATYRLTLTDSNGSPVAPGTGHYGDVGCSPFNGYIASGVPWSELPGYPADQQTSFVDNCTLTPVPGQPGAFDLTLSGINYDLATVPAKDSAGSPLPTDWSYIASGSVWFEISTAQNGSLSLQASTPTYTSANGMFTSTDLAENNVTNKSFVLPGRWAASWWRPYTGAGGTNWDDTYRVSAGTTVVQYINNAGSMLNVPDSTLDGQCLVFDTQYATYTPEPEGAILPTLRGYDHDGSAALLNNPPPVEYYVGSVANPDTFNCGSDPANWTTDEPDNLSTVQAIRVVHPHSLYEDEGWDGVQLAGYTTINPDVPIGQDVWMFGSVLTNGTWEGSHPTQIITPTPGARYPHTDGRRDILRIIYATPSIQKSVDRSVVSPGVPANFTLTYSANGAGALPETVDDYGITDTLPVGMTYVAGSADPEPTITTDGQGRQVLTWSLDDVPTNAAQTLTYQAVAADSVEPGQVLQNTATSTLAGETSQPAIAQVTVSTSGYTQIAKTADQWFIANPDGSGDGEGSWTVTLRSQDPLPQAFTDTIDILPYNGDGRGTSFSGDYTIEELNVPGSTVYYTTEDPATLSDDPDDPTNGARNAPSGIWSTTYTPDATAIRVIGGELAPGESRSFQIDMTTEGAAPGDVWMNRAQARAGHTELVMRTSEPLTMGTMYSASLKKFVQDADGEWRDANDVADYPKFRPGETVNYRIVVENTGQGTLRDILLRDDQQPELGAHLIEELAPGEEEAHEYEIVLDENTPQTLINNACASAPAPADSEVEPTINCDPAGLEIDGDPEHEKSLVSAEPIGDGQWQVVYGITVRNTLPYATSYNLEDTLRFTDQADIQSAQVTQAPDGVTLADPAWDGQGNVLIAAQVPLLANNDPAYAEHYYEVTVVADVPLQLDGAGSGEGDPTRCGPDGDDANTAFNNTSAMTDARGEVEDDQACAELPSIDIDKEFAGLPVVEGDRYTTTYDIVVANDGGLAGGYVLHDQLRFGAGMTIEQVTATNTDPGDIDVLESYTGQGADLTDEENALTGEVELAAGAAHTYRVVVVSTLDKDAIVDASDKCADTDADGTGGLRNVAVVTHNGLTDADTACAPFEWPNEPTPPTPGENPPGTDTPAAAKGNLPSTGSQVGSIVALGAALMVLAGLAARAAARRREEV